MAKLSGLTLMCPKCRKMFLSTENKLVCDDCKDRPTLLPEIIVDLADAFQWLKDNA